MIGRLNRRKDSRFFLRPPARHPLLQPEASAAEPGGRPRRDGATFWSCAPAPRGRRRGPAPA
eukprot:180671-Pyramimonas_sp.AAC.1